MTEYTKRLMVVTRDADAPDANLAAKTVDTGGGEHTFTVPIGGVARWCNWAMKPGEAAALEAEFAAQRLLHAVEVRPDGNGGFRPEVAARSLIFDADDWTPEQVQAVLAASDPVLAEGIPEGATDGVVL